MALGKFLLCLFLIQSFSANAQLKSDNKEMGKVREKAEKGFSDLTKKCDALSGMKETSASQECQSMQKSMKGSCKAVTESYKEAMTKMGNEKLSDGCIRVANPAVQSAGNMVGHLGYDHGQKCKDPSSKTFGDAFFGTKGSVTDIHNGLGSALIEYCTAIDWKEPKKDEPKKVKN